MYILYDIFFIIFVILYLPFMLIKGKWHKDVFNRFGWPLLECKSQLQKKPTIWIHAVSVGEVLAVWGLAQKLKMVFPGHQLVCTTVTKTGYELARSKFTKDSYVFYAPFDLSKAVKTYIDTIQPKVYISTETEIWPNMYTALKRNRIPIIQVNGRISDKAFNGYKKVGFLTRKILACVDSFCMQTALDAERIEHLGAEKKKICVVGNLKFETETLIDSTTFDDLSLPGNIPFLIGGSTHLGEEEILIETFKKLIIEFPDLRLILAPRHVERTEEVVNIVENHELTPIKLSELKKHSFDWKSVIVVDIIGKLKDLYASARVVFVGKSLCVGGGQNMIEPAFYGKPVVVGPLTQNFRDIMQIFLSAEAMIQVKDKEELFVKIKKLLSDQGESDRIGGAAKRTIRENQGATKKTMAIITGIVNSAI